MQSDTEHSVERRRHHRHRVSESAVAFYGRWPCSIVDISSSGIAVTCATTDRERPVFDQLDIFLADASFYLPQVPVELVTEVHTPPRSMFSSLQFRRIGLKFGPLSSEQQARIHEFIQHGSTPSAS